MGEDEVMINIAENTDAIRELKKKVKVQTLDLSESLKKAGGNHLSHLAY